MREIRTSGSTRGRRAADFNPLRVVLLYRLPNFRRDRALAESRSNAAIPCVTHPK